MHTMDHYCLLPPQGEDGEPGPAGAPGARVSY